MDGDAFAARGRLRRRDVHGSDRTLGGAEYVTMFRILKLARKLFWLNLIAAIPVYFYVMYEFKMAGMW